MSTLTKDQIERIAFTKYLLSQAKSQKDKAIPTCSFAVLIMHDLVEIFLQVAVEIHVPGFQKPKASILETMTNNLNNVLASGGNAINIQFINRLNGRRNSLKHSTIFVNDMDVQNLYSETETFFTDFCTVLFGLQFHEISLVAMINNDMVKAHLFEAESYWAKSNFNEAIISITKAYHYFERAELKVKGVIKWAGFKKDYVRDFARRRASMGGKELDSNLERLASQVGNDISELDKRITEVERVVSLGIDYNTFKKFQKRLPHIYLPNTGDTEDVLNFMTPSADKIVLFGYDEDDVKFCFDFVLNVSLKLKS